MDNRDFDRALIAAAFGIAAERGWHAVSPAAAARAAGLPLALARRRFPGRAAILLRFGRLADEAALDGLSMDGSVRDRLFDMLMRRFDALQANRAGVLALFGALPFDPPAALMLACLTRRSMAWLLEAAGASAAGPRGALRTKGLVAVWLWAMRAWRSDESEDLSATMAALDTALGRAEQAAGWLDGAARPAAAEETPRAEPGEDEPPPLAAGEPGPV